MTDDFAIFWLTAMGLVGLGCYLGFHPADCTYRTWWTRRIFRSFLQKFRPVLESRLLTYGLMLESRLVNHKTFLVGDLVVPGGETLQVSIGHVEYAENTLELSLTNVTRNRTVELVNVRPPGFLWTQRSLEAAVDRVLTRWEQTWEAEYTR